MLNDALESVDVLKRSDEEPKPEIRIRCRECKAPNSDHAKFCEQCGRRL